MLGQVRGGDTKSRLENVTMGAVQQQAHLPGTEDLSTQPLGIDPLQSSESAGQAPIKGQGNLDDDPPQLSNVLTASAGNNNSLDISSVQPSDVTELKPTNGRDIATTGLSSIAAPAEPQAPPCHLLDRLAAEIRAMIYEELLLSPVLICNAHKLIGPKRSLILQSNKPIANVDSTFLRTCRKIYNEARPILYGSNWFGWTKITHLENFAYDGLPDLYGLTTCGLRKERYGRLSEIRNVSLCLDKQYSYQILREDVAGSWMGFLVGRGWKHAAFPSVQRLSLDFSYWNLTSSEEHALVVKPFIDCFRKSGGLQELNSRNISYEKNLEDLKYGLVKDGGRFVVMGSEDDCIVNCIVRKDGRGAK